MLSTIRETLTSLKDKSYGNVIITKRFWPVVWYWTKYLLVFTLVPWIAFVFILTYFLPQLPRLIKDHVPQAKVSLQNGRFSTSLPDGTKYGDKSFSLIINTQATSSALLQNYDGGVLIASTTAYLKSSDGQSESTQYPSSISFSISTSQIISWISTHQGQLWLYSFLGLTMFTLFASTLYWSYSLSAIAFGGFILWLIARIIHRELDIRGAIKIAIYAAVLPFLLGALFSTSSNPFMFIINLTIFFYLGYNWIQNLPQQTK